MLSGIQAAKTLVHLAHIQEDALSVWSRVSRDHIFHIKQVWNSYIVSNFEGKLERMLPPCSIGDVQRLEWPNLVRKMCM